MPAVFPGVDIVLMYGLTESFRSTWLEPRRFAAKMGAIGQAIPGAEVYVVKPEGGIAGPGEQGELVHRGPLVSMGYWGRPDATAEKIRPCPALSALIGDEPVVWSGDTVRVDEDGDLWFVARADAMIKTSGFRLSPDEVEDLVCRSGLVADAVAFGVDDDDLGQVVHVALTALPDFDVDALTRHCRRTMPHYMVPAALSRLDRSDAEDRERQAREAGDRGAMPQLAGGRAATDGSRIAHMQTRGASMALTEAQLIGYLRDSLSVDGNLDPDSELFSNGALNSVAMLSLIAFVEEKSGIEIRPEHVTLDNFDTPGRIVRFAESLR